MNHGASAPTLDEIPALSINTGNTTQNNGEEENASSGGSSRESSITLQFKIRKEHLKQLITALDLLIYIQLATANYMDCSIVLIFIRTAVQFSYLTPKARTTPFPKPPFPALVAILACNLLSILLHTFTRGPSAGEATRGYMHGSLLLDFVGQKGPTSKIRLVALDILVLGLQLLMLAVGEEIKKAGHGQLERRGSNPVSEEDGMELQSLDPGGRRDGGFSGEEGPNAVPMEMDNVLGNQEGEAIIAHPLDEMHGGQMIVAEFNIFDTVRNQFWDYRNGPRGGV